MAGLYIHIPFCASRCIYCGFYSTTHLTLQDRYINAVCKEMELTADQHAPLTTIYLGGGTPSQLSATNLHKLFYNINKVYGDHADREVTIECNPDDVTDAFCQTLRTLPVNRISMGAQTFSDDRLRFLRRRHTADDVQRAVSKLRHIGIRNISLDLMFGFPQETLDHWQRDIDTALSLDIEHLSAYSLMYEEGTPLYAQLQTSAIQRIDEETERLMYDTLIDRLTAAGYEHYEISNFAKHTYRSRHNSSYWDGTPYTGLGAAAHSYDGHHRRWNVSDIQAYINALEQILPDNPPAATILSPATAKVLHEQLEGILYQQETIDAVTHYNDLITTALRTREGLNLSTLDEPYRTYLLKNAQQSLAHGFLRIDDTHIHLTRQGLFISDSVMSDLIWIEE